MARIYIYTLLFVMLSIIPEAKATPPMSPYERAVSSIEDSAYKKIYRDGQIKIDNLMDMDILRIRTGMTILDIGTSIGYNAYKFAERLKGTGMVFATDILTDRIDYVKKEARKRGLNNLYPVLVKREGVDEFYGRQKYDLIFLSYVYHRLDNRVEYFKIMKEFLNEGGQLVVLICKSTPLFYPEDFNDFEGLAKELAHGERLENKPFYDNMRESTQEQLRKKSEGKIQESLKKAIIEDFNAMLLNPQFYKNFMSTFFFEAVAHSLSAAEKDFINWLLMCLKEEGGLEKPKEDLDAKEMRAVIKLNKIFFIQRFGNRLYNGNYGEFFKTSDIHRQTSYFLVKKELAAAGYKLEKEYDQLPYHVILFFTANKDKNN